MSQLSAQFVNCCCVGIKALQLNKLSIGKLRYESWCTGWKYCMNVCNYDLKYYLA